MKKKLNLFLLLLVMMLFVTRCIGPIQDVNYHPSSLITIRDSLTTIRFTLYSEDKPVKPKKGRQYYWYGTNRIHTNKGDYSGRLLDGTYTTYNETGALIIKGSYDRGLKTGQWVTWTPAGEVRYCLKYRQGFAKDTNGTSWIKKIFSTKKDSTTVKLQKKNKEKPKKKETREKGKNGTQK